MEEAAAMLRIARNAGTTDIVATPHANEQFTFDADIVERKATELQAATGNLIRIHTGCELHFTRENIEEAISAPGKYSINHRGYLLVEFSDFLVPLTAGEVFSRMIAAGLQPIIAHPERNPLLRKRLSELESWIRNGCLTQVTAESILGRFGKAAKAASDELMRRGLVHFLASDAHDSKHRPPSMDAAASYVRKQYGDELAEVLLEENPRCALAGTDVRFDLTLLSTTPKSRKWFAL